MPNTLTISIRGKDGYDLAGFMDALEQGLFTMDAGDSELLGPEGAASWWNPDVASELRIPYTTIDGELHAEGFILIPDTLPIARASFSSPEGLGVPVWTDMLPLSLYDALLGDTRFDIRGSQGDDSATGSDFGDRFRMGGGDDSVFGGDGDDQISGGRGNDLLIGGSGNDTMLGGGGNDMLVLGDGNTLGNVTARGGSGNDIFVQLSGQADIRGGAGSDMFIFAAEPGQGVRSLVRDFGANDILLLADWGTPIGTLTGETLADLENGMIDDFQWRETNRGVEIEAGDARIFLRGVDADEIDLDQILFAQQSAQDSATLFDGTADGEMLGQTVGGDDFIAFGTEGSTWMVGPIYGAGIATFIAFGDEGTGFIADSFSFG